MFSKSFDRSPSKVNSVDADDIRRARAAVPAGEFHRV